MALERDGALLFSRCRALPMCLAWLRVAVCHVYAPPYRGRGSEYSSRRTKRAAHARMQRAQSYTRTVRAGSASMASYLANSRNVVNIAFRCSTPPSLPPFPAFATGVHVCPAPSLPAVHAHRHVHEDGKAGESARQGGGKGWWQGEIQARQEAHDMSAQSSVRKRAAEDVTAVALTPSRRRSQPAFHSNKAKRENNGTRRCGYRRGEHMAVAFSEKGVEKRSLADDVERRDGS